MNLLNLRINNRIDKTINFDRNDINLQDKNNHYVLRRVGGLNSFELIRLFANNHIDNNGEQRTCVMVLNKERTKISSSAGEETTIVINLVENRNEMNELDGIEIRKESNGGNAEQWVLVVDANRILGNKIDLVITIGDVPNGDVPNEERHLFFHVAENVYDAIVDFGSEASQSYWEYMRNDGSVIPHNVDLTKGILGDVRNSIKASKQASESATNSYYEADVTQYIQDERSPDANFFRSIYYIKKKLTNCDKLDVWPEYNKETLKYLVRNDYEIKGLSDYMQIPNTKLLNSLVGNYTPTQVSILGADGNIERTDGLSNLWEGVVPRLLMNNIIYQTLKDIDAAATPSSAVVLNVLMPNLYSIQEVSFKLNLLAEDIERLIANKKLSNIIGVELRYVSESDASMLGYISGMFARREYIDEGNYLIVDAGKGTLDFSLLEVGINGEKNTCRSGIVGAGAAVSYGVLVGLVNEYLCTVYDGFVEKDETLQKRDIREFIHKKFLQGEVDIANVIKAMGLVDQYKIKYNEKYNDPAPESPAKDIDHSSDEMNEQMIEYFDTLVSSWISNSYKLSQRSCSYISATINMIALQAARRMDIVLKSDRNRTPVDNIVFAGRGCLMKELQDKLFKAIQAKGLLSDPTILPIVLDAATIKTGCLHIIDRLNNGNYDASASNQLFFLHDVVVRRDNVDASQTKTTEGRSGGILNTIWKWAIDIFDGFNADDDSKKQGNPYVGAKVGKIRSTQACLYIGGYIYQILGRFKGHESKLYFDGRNFCLTAKNVPPQVLTATRIRVQETPLEFATLFPNVRIERRDQVVIPDCENFEEQVKGSTPQSPKEQASAKKNQETNQPDNPEEEKGKTGESKKSVPKWLENIKKRKLFLQSFEDENTDL